MSKPKENTPAAVLVKTLAEFYELVRLYQVATSIQYARKQRGGQAGGGSKGSRSDPTGAMASANVGHKSVRIAVVLVDEEVERLYAQVVRLQNILGDAIDRWDS
jgi:hypothetical protein